MLTDPLSPGSQHPIHNLHRCLVTASRRRQWPVWPAHEYSPGGPMLLVHAPDRKTLWSESRYPSGGHYARRSAGNSSVHPQTPPAISFLPPLGRPLELRPRHPRDP